MSDTSISSAFEALYADIKPETQFYNKKPLLAHYTSLNVLEKIAANKEIWFSNPLFMNDHEELKFGVNTGRDIAKSSEAIKTALGTASRHELFVNAIEGYYQEFDRDHVFDTYVFCATEHDPQNADGLLSMWRGYGGNGNGVAVIFNTANMTPAAQGTPLILAQVNYGTSEERTEYLQRLCDLTAEIISKNAIPDDKVYVASYMLFDRIKLFALFSKHHGFAEEREWRAVYRRDMDKEKKFDQLFGYFLSGNGVEPKLKFRIAPVQGITAEDLSLEKIVDRIILGPSSSSFLAQRSVQRMLELLGNPELAQRVIASGIPLRQR